MAVIQEVGLPQQIGCSYPLLQLSSFQWYSQFILDWSHDIFFHWIQIKAIHKKCLEWFITVMSNQNGKSIHMDSHLASASSLRDSKCHFWDILDWSHCDTKIFWSVASKVRHLLLFTCFSIWEFCKIKEWDISFLNRHFVKNTTIFVNTILSSNHELFKK